MEPKTVVELRMSLTDDQLLMCNMQLAPFLPALYRKQVQSALRWPLLFPPPSVVL